MGKFGQENQNCQFKLKFGTNTNLNMQHLVVLYPSGAKFILEAEVWFQKFEICRINLIQDVRGKGVGQKCPPPPTSLSRVTSRKVETSPKNFLTFSINFFTILV